MVEVYPENLGERLQQAYPELDAVRDAAGDPVYLVGGAVRDLLLGRDRGDVDLVVVGDANALTARLGADAVSHERFGTAKLKLDGHEVDIAAARSESYPRPGALPVVEPSTNLQADLARRDFTVNAMAIPLQGEASLIDPFGGKADLAEKRLRILHEGSFEDDPTRAIRAARYAARLDLSLEPQTERRLRDADLGAVSANRRDAELMRLAADPNAGRAFRLLEEWGVIVLADGGSDLVEKAEAVLAAEPWRKFAPRDRALFAAAMEPFGGEQELARRRPARPSEGVVLAEDYGPIELVIARALGAEWLDDYVSKWRSVKLEIDGEDLIAAGVPQGPAVGRGLKQALHSKLDGEVSDADEELAVALRVARCG